MSTTEIKRFYVVILIESKQTKNWTFYCWVLTFEISCSHQIMLIDVNTVFKCPEHEYARLVQTFLLTLSVTIITNMHSSIHINNTGCERY